MIFDTWGGLLSEAHYREFSLDPMARIIQDLKTRHGCELPVIVFSKGCHTQINDMLSSGCAGVGVDWRIHINTALQLAAGKAAVQGNLDPTVLLSQPANVSQIVREQFSEAVKQPGFIFNLGHGIMPDVPPENVTALIQAFQELSG